MARYTDEKLKGLEGKYGRESGEVAYPETFESFGPIELEKLGETARPKGIIVSAPQLIQRLEQEGREEDEVDPQLFNKNLEQYKKNQKILEVEVAKLHDDLSIRDQENLPEDYTEFLKANYPHLIEIFGENNRDIQNSLISAAVRIKDKSLFINRLNQDLGQPAQFYLLKASNFAENVITSFLQGKKTVTAAA